MKIGDDITTTDYIEGKCNISTPEVCFTTNYILESYEIGDNCENYFINDGWSQKDVTTFCNGGTVSYGSTLKEIIELGYLDIEELQTNNVIKNVVMKDGVSIIDYYSGSGCGTNVIIPSKINNKEVVAIGNYAFEDNQLTSVEIKNDNTTMGVCLFIGNYNLTTVKVAGIDKNIYEISPCDL